LAHVDADERERFALMLNESWEPNSADDPSNGSVWTCLAQAVWAVRHNGRFEDVLVAAIELGGDTDTVATVAGAIAGARDSVQAIPSRWLTYINGELETPEGLAGFDNAGLQDLARSLVGRGPVAATAPEPSAGPTEVAPGVHAANLFGAQDAPVSWGVVSLCRTFGAFDGHTARREVFLIDQSGPANADPATAVRDAVDAIDALLAEGRTVVVHCHGGHSRTGLVLKAWSMRTNGFTEREAHVWLSERWDQYQDYQKSFIELLETDW
jgi:ADP-ribosyl-[dinitrogen reductase] hydrolase